MAELDEKLAAMMADPNIMAQVAAMAKSLGMAPPGPLGDLLSRWLPSGMDREDLLILLLILATSPDDSTAGLTVALYFALA